MPQIQHSRKIPGKKGVDEKARWIGALLVFLLLLLVPLAGWGEDPHVEWSDYRKPCRQSIWVRQNKRGSIESPAIVVNLPDHFLKSHKKIILVIDIESRTVGAFEAFRPYIKIGSSIFKGNYTIPVKSSPQRQIQEIEIKNKHLKVGENTLKPEYRWRKRGMYCAGYGCGYIVHKISFKDAPALGGYTLKVSSTPSGAKVFLEKKYMGETPLQLPDLRKQTYRIRLEKDGYETLEDRVVLSKDKSRSYELQPEDKNTSTP
jgi:hypothetical protein